MKIVLPGTGVNECIPAFRCECSVCNHAREKGMSGKFLFNKDTTSLKTSTGDYNNHNFLFFI